MRGGACVRARVVGCRCEGNDCAGSKGGIHMGRMRGEPVRGGHICLVGVCMCGDVCGGRVWWTCVVGVCCGRVLWACVGLWACVVGV
jgi:hypothetical protein